MTGVSDNPVTGFFTWSEIGTYTGATAITLVVVRALQNYLAWLPPIVLAYGIAALLLIAADVFLPPPPSASSIVLCLVNAIGVAITAIGSSSVLDLPGGHR